MGGDKQLTLTALADKQWKTVIAVRVFPLAVYAVCGRLTPTRLRGPSLLVSFGKKLAVSQVLTLHFF
jgi:hypothetical protein